MGTGNLLITRGPGIERAYGSYEELCKDPSIDVVYVATLHPQHAEHATMALNCGNHVLVEKPIAINVREAEQLIRLARDKQLFLAEGWCFEEYVRDFLAIDA